MTRRRTRLDRQPHQGLHGGPLCAGPLRRVDEGLLWATLRLMRDELDPPWLHVLGALQHERIGRFRLLGVTSADSKQWARGYTRFPDYGRTGRVTLQDRFVRRFYFQWQPPLFVRGSPPAD